MTRKIVEAAARIGAQLDKHVSLGNLDARRDWGYAPEYVDAMWRMLQTEEPRDFVIGTGEHHTPREICEIAFERVGLDYRDHGEVDERFKRPAEVDTLLADPRRARDELGWEARTSFRELIEVMVDAEIALLERRGAGA